MYANVSMGTISRVKIFVHMQEIVASRDARLAMVYSSKTGSARRQTKACKDVWHAAGLC